MVLRLQSLELEGFRSFRDTALFMFPDSGMILISGRYVDREISSGSGKSTPAIAIAFALGFSSLPATELKNRDSKSLSVKLILTDGVHQYTIIRNPKLKMITPEGESDGKVAEEKLKQLLRIPSNLAEAITYREQRQHGRFMNSTDSQNKEFLGTLLGISQIEEAADELKSELDLLVSKKDRIEENIRMRQTMAESCKVSDEDFTAAKSSYEQASLRCQQLESGDQLSILNGQISQARMNVKQAGDAVAKADYAKSQNLLARKQIIESQEALKTLESNICPTCRREWMEGQGLIEQKKANIQALLDKMATNLEIIRNAQPTIDNLPAMEQQCQDISVQMGQLQAPIQDAQSALQTARIHLQRLSEQKDQSERIQRLLETERLEIVGLITEIEVARHAVEILSRNGFLGAIFDELLIDIESRTNEMMGQIPNIDAYSVNISSTSVTKTGNAKKTINVRLHHDGKEVHPKTLSGGQMVSAELCTDLSVSEAIRSRSGSPLGWIILDESMDGLDLETKKAALRVIRSKIKGQILVIDHSTEIKENFESVITIEFDGRESKIINT